MEQRVLLFPVPRRGGYASHGNALQKLARVYRKTSRKWDTEEFASTAANMM